MNAGSKNDVIFAQGSRPRPTVGTIVLFVIAALLVFGGFYLMGVAFEFEGLQGFLTFGGAVIVDAIGFWLAFGLIPSREDMAIKP